MEEAKKLEEEFVGDACIPLTKDEQKEYDAWLTWVIYDSFEEHEKAIAEKDEEIAGLKDEVEKLKGELENVKKEHEASLSESKEKMDSLVEENTKLGKKVREQMIERILDLRGVPSEAREEERKVYAERSQDSINDTIDDILKNRYQPFGSVEKETLAKDGGGDIGVKSAGSTKLIRIPTRRAERMIHHKKIAEKLSK